MNLPLENIVWRWTPPAELREDIPQDCADEYAIELRPEAIGGIVLYEFYHGEWHRNPWNSRHVIAELLRQEQSVQKQAAAMREALTRILDGTGHTPGFKEEYCPHCIAKTALTTDAGANYVSKDAVRPLVEALDGIRANLTPWQQLVIATKDSLELLEDGIAHARTLGL